MMQSPNVRLKTIQKVIKADTSRNSIDVIKETPFELGQNNRKVSAKMRSINHLSYNSSTGGTRM